MHFCSVQVSSLALLTTKTASLPAMTMGQVIASCSDWLQTVTAAAGIYEICKQVDQLLSPLLAVARAKYSLISLRSRWPLEM